MRYLKLLGLAGIAAMAVIGIGGAGTASATVLCKATETPCGASNLLSTGKEIKAYVAPTNPVIVFQTTEGVILEKCTGSTLATTVAKAGGASEATVIGLPKAALTWSGCTKGVETKSSGEFEVQHIAGTDNGTVTNNKSFFSPYFEISIYKGECAYYLAPQQHIGVITGGVGEATPPKFQIFTVLKWREGLGCPNHIMMKVFYTITEPNPLYVRPS